MKPRSLEISVTRSWKRKKGICTSKVFRLRIQKATGQLDQTGKVRATRKDLARVKTIRVERKKTAAKDKADKTA